MASFLMLKQVVLSRKAFRVALARNDWAAVTLRTVNLAFVPDQTSFVAELRVLATWDITDIWFAVLVLMFAE
jgi:hypothetical protein